MAVLAKLGWKVVGTGSGLLTGVVTKKLLDVGWARVNGGPPPANPKQADVSWREALAWTVASSAVMGVARLVAGRVAAGAWQRATGTLPPGMSTPSGTHSRPGRPPSRT